jgi:hypothetical protein
MKLEMSPPFSLKFKLIAVRAISLDRFWDFWEKWSLESWISLHAPYLPQLLFTVFASLQVLPVG